MGSPGLRAVLVAGALGAVAVAGCEGSATRQVDPSRLQPRTATTSRPRRSPARPLTTTTPTTPTTVPPTTVTIVAAHMPPGVDGPLPVARVVDGDTIKVSTGVTLRLIGMDTPETVDPRKPVQCFGPEASTRAHELLDNTSVSLEYDSTQGRLDRYGRTLAYVWMSDGRLYNQLMIEDGFAHEYTYSAPYKYQAAFIAAQQDARQTARGLWSPATCAGDTATPTSGIGVVPAPTPGCDPSYPGVCIPSPPPDLDCGDIPERNFAVVGADPHRFDGNHDGIGCEG
jgi:micrococcal nuclease